MPNAKPIIRGKRECTKCGSTRFVAEFVRESRASRGIAAHCKECARKDGRARRRKNITQYLTREARRRTKNRKHIRAWMKERRKKRRKMLFAHYGHKCVCCGEDRFEFLSIDHIGGGGNQHRKRDGSDLREWLIKNNFPSGFQILCHNCNFSKGIYGYCPHKKK